MPQIIGVRVHFNDARSPVVHQLGRSYNAHLEDGVLSVYDERGDRLASHASMEWAWAELCYGQIVEARISHLTAEKIRPEPQPEGSTFTWPYDPTSGTVSTDDAVEQAKHEAADHILQARVGEAEQAVREAMRHLALVRAEQFADEQGDAA